MADVGDEWERILSAGHSETKYTVTVSGEDIWLTTTQDPVEPEDGLLISAGDWLTMTVERDDPLFAKTQSQNASATVRVVGGLVPSRQPRRTITATVAEDVTLSNTGGATINPATEGTLSSTLSREVATWSAGTLPVEQQTPVAVEDATGTQVSPATEGSLTSVQPRSISTWNAGTLPTEQQTPVGVEDSTGTQINPSKNANGASTSASASGTGSANAASITVPDGRETVTVAYDTSGAATITVEVSPDGGTTWYPLTSYSPGSAASNADTIQVGFDDVRAYIDANLNSLHIGGKGV